jgi:hypothetical protein
VVVPSFLLGRVVAPAGRADSTATSLVATGSYQVTRARSVPLAAAVASSRQVLSQAPGRWGQGSGPRHDRTTNERGGRDGRPTGPKPGITPVAYRVRPHRDHHRDHRNGATSPPHAGRSPAPTARRSWSPAKALTAARDRSWRPCCMRPPTAWPPPEGQGHQPSGPLAQPALRRPRRRARPSGRLQPAHRLVPYHPRREATRPLPRPAHPAGRRAGTLAPLGTAAGTGGHLAEPAGLLVRVRPQAPRRPRHPGPGPDPVRPLPAAVRTRRTDVDLKQAVSQTPRSRRR